MFKTKVSSVKVINLCPSENSKNQLFYLLLQGGHLNNTNLTIIKTNLGVYEQYIFEKGAPHYGV